MNTVPAELPRKLNLGCGFDLREGYLNVDVNDFHKPDLVSDVTALPALPSDYFDEVLAQDVLEHIPRLRTESTLSEWFRLVRPGGHLRLRLPNLLGLLKLLGESGRQSIDDQRLLIQCAYGTQAYEGDFHLSGFTPRLLAQQLVTIGFDQIQIQEKDEWLMDVIATKAGGAQKAEQNILSNQAVFVFGWYSAEADGDHSLRWSNGRSFINLRKHAGKTAQVSFVTFGEGLGLPMLQVKLTDLMTNTVLQTLQIRSGHTQTARLLIDSDDFLFEVASSATYVPSLCEPASVDTRPLGVGVNKLELI